MFRQNKTEKYIGDYIKKHCKRSRQFKIDSAASQILTFFSNEVKDFWKFYNEFKDWDFNPFPRIGIYKPIVGRKYFSRSELAGGVSSLDRGGYIKRSKKSQMVRLTQKGVCEMLKYRMKNKCADKKVWDGKWRIIVFDIKEETRRDRNFLRQQLKWIGFQELQKSVWVFPYEVRDELREFAKLCKCKFQGDVRFILADKIERDNVLRQQFSLPELL